MHVWTRSHLDTLLLQLEVEVAQQPEEGGCEVTQTLVACSGFEYKFEYVQAGVRSSFPFLRPDLV